MKRHDTLEACLQDLFSEDQELAEKYTPQVTARVIRIRDIYNQVMDKPELKDRQIVDYIMQAHQVGKTAAYDDLAIIKTLLPNMAANSKAWHRWRFNTLILETYQMAKARKDTKTMERAMSTYAKYNAIDIDEERELPYDIIAVQPFIPTQDPTVLGIKPLPNRRERIKQLIAKYTEQSADILDITAETVDLPELQQLPSNI